jgi:hypothetical protein
MLGDAVQHVLAFYAFWSKLRSTNPLERFNKEIGRRTNVVGILPDDRSLTRLVGMLCLEQNDQWLVGRRYLSAAAMSRFSRSGSMATPPPTTGRSRSSQQSKQPATYQRRGAYSDTTSRDLTPSPHEVRRRSLTEGGPATRGGRRLIPCRN